MSNLFNDIPILDDNNKINIYNNDKIINNTNYDELIFNINNTDLSWNKFKVYASSYDNHKYATISNIMYQDPHIIPYLPGEDSRIRLGKYGNKQNNTWWDIASDKYGNFHIFNENQDNKGIVINPNGNIGVGTINPQTKLQVVGDISANRFIGSGSLMTNLDPDNINGIVSQSRGGTGVAFLDPNYFDTSNNKLSLKLSSITPWNVNTDNLYYNNGNIGVGTINPQTKLQVIGDISANRFIGSGSLMTNLDPNNIDGIIPQSRGGTGVASLDMNKFKIVDNKLSLKQNINFQYLETIFGEPLFIWEGYDSFENSISLYQHCNYGGYSISLTAGEYRLNDLQTKPGFKNDDISSIIFNQKNTLKAILYEHDNFSGQVFELTDNNSCFINNNFNDKLSSIKVINIDDNTTISKKNPIFDVLFNILEIVGTTTFNNTYYNVLWNHRYMIGVVNTTKTFDKPTNYLRIRLQIDPNTHNSVFIQCITRDRWSLINMFICDPITKIPDIKIQSRTNNHNNNGTTGNSSFLGPNNEIAHSGYHEWLQFCIPKEFIDRYKKSSNEIIISINAGTHNSNNELWISGIASCPNPYGICTLSAVDLHWATNGGNTITWNSGAWNEEAIAQFDVNKDYLDIRIPIASTNKAVYIVHIDHGNTWFGSNPRIYVPGFSSTKYWKLSPTSIGKFGMSIKGRAVYREPRGILLPADVVEKGAVRDHNGALQLKIRVNMVLAMHILYTRGWYSEQFEQL